MVTKPTVGLSPGTQWPALVTPRSGQNQMWPGKENEALAADTEFQVKPKTQ
jgi:hypothetical protein